MISTFVQLTFNTCNSLLTLSLSESKPNTCLDEHSHQSGGKKRKSPNVSCLDVDDDDVTVDMTGLSESAVPPLVGELQNLEKELKEIHNVFRCYLVLFKFHFV